MYCILLRIATGVWIQWNGMVEWNSAMEEWNETMSYIDILTKGSPPYDNHPRQSHLEIFLVQSPADCYK